MCARHCTRLFPYSAPLLFSAHMPSHPSTFVQAVPSAWKPPPFPALHHPSKPEKYGPGPLPGKLLGLRKAPFSTSGHPRTVRQTTLLKRMTFRSLISFYHHTTSSSPHFTDKETDLLQVLPQVRSRPLTERCRHHAEHPTHGI